MRSPCCLYVCVCVPPNPLLNASTDFMKAEPNSMAYFINPFHQSVCLYVYPLTLLGTGSVKKNVKVAMNTQATMEEFWMRRLPCGPCRTKEK
jgi:hypothetical protein